MVLLELRCKATLIMNTTQTSQIKQTLALAFCLAVAPVHGATIVWSGASGTDTNWSNGNNWAGTVAPGGGDDVKFFDAGNSLVLGAPNSLVDVAFGGYIGSLQLGNTNGTHTIVIAAGTSLGITNGSLAMGMPTDGGVSKNLTNTITGAGGRFMSATSPPTFPLIRPTALRHPVARV